MFFEELHEVVEDLCFPVLGFCFLCAGGAHQLAADAVEYLEVACEYFALVEESGLLYFFADGLVDVEYFLCFFVGKWEQGGGREEFPYGDGSLRVVFCDEFVVGEGYDGDPAVGRDFEALTDVSGLHDQYVVAAEFVFGEVELRAYVSVQAYHRHGEFYLEGVG